MPIPGSPPTQDERARHEPAAEDPVELADPDRPARDVGLADRGQAAIGRRRRRRGPAHAAGVAARLARTTVSTRLFHAAAGAALALPAQEGFAAASGRRSGSGPRHVAPRGGVDVSASTGRPRLGGVDVEAGLRVLVDDDRRARLVAAEQQVLGEHVLDHVLDDAAQRAGAVGHVVAELDDVLLGRLGDLERHLLRAELVAHALRASGRRSA